MILLLKKLEKPQYAWLKSLLDSDRKLASELAKKQQDEIKAAQEVDKPVVPKNQSLLQTFGALFKGSSVEDKSGDKQYPLETTIN